MSTRITEPRERPKPFADDWGSPGSPRPPTTIANPPGRLEIATRPMTAEEVAAAGGVDRRGGLDLSPDGSEVTFAWDRSGILEIYAAPLVGDRIIQLTNGATRSTAPRWSPDGHWVAFARERGGRTVLWAVDRDGEHEHEVTSEEPLHEQLRLAPDGVPTWTQDTGGRSLDAAKIDHLPGSARTSPDGSTIAFATTIDGRARIAFASIEDGAVARVSIVGRGLPFDDDDPVWRPDGRGVVYRRHEQGTVTLRRVFTISHADEGVIDVPGWLFSPRVAPDSETVVAILVDRNGANVVVRPRGAVEIQRLTGAQRNSPGG